MHLNNNNNNEPIDEDEGSDDDDSSFDDSDLEDSIYESFTTPLDDPDNNIDEYVVFKDVFNSKYSFHSLNWLKIANSNLVMVFEVW